MGETLPPALAAPFDDRPDRPARLEQAAQPGAAPVFGEVDDQIVMARLQAVEQRQFGLELADGTELLPFAVDGVHAGNGRMESQHLGRIGVNQRIDLDLRNMRLEYR